jgi:hypothetical protein
MAAILVFTVYNALVECGVDDVALFIFETCMDLTFKELDEHFKTYSEITVQQGQLRIRPGVRKNIKAFIQWTRNEFRLGRDPSSIAFPVDNVSDLQTLQNP